MVAFCCGVSCASFLYRSTAGIFAKVFELLLATHAKVQKACAIEIASSVSSP